VARLFNVPTRLRVLLTFFALSGVAFNIFTAWLPRHVAVNCAGIEARYAHAPAGDYVYANALWIIPAVLSMAIYRYTTAYGLCLLIWGLALLGGLSQVDLGPIERGGLSCVEVFYWWRLEAQAVPFVATILIAVLAVVVAILAAVRVVRPKKPS
jgi:hypothetical protein